MEKKKIIADNSISDFVRQSVGEIQKGLPEGYELVDEIEFEVSVEAQTNRKGELTFKIVSGGQQTNKIQTHKINFAIANPVKQREQDHAEAQLSVKVFKSMMFSLAELANKFPPTKKENKNPEEQIKTSEKQ